MKRALTLLFALALSLTLAFGAAEDEVRKTELAWAAAVQKGDQKTLDGMLGETLVYTHSSGVIETKAEYLAKLKTGAQTYKSIEHQDMKVQVHGDAGIVTTKVRMTGSTKGVPFDNQLLMIHVWIKQAGKWRLVAHQTTRLNP